MATRDPLFLVKYIFLAIFLSLSLSSSLFSFSLFLLHSLFSVFTFILYVASFSSFLLGVIRHEKLRFSGTPCAILRFKERKSR